MKLTELLDQIDRLDQKATRSPWGVIKHDYYEVGPLENDEGETVMSYDVAALADQPDAEFIALARTALPAMSKALRAVLAVHEPIDDYIHLRDRICSHRHCVDDALDQMEYPCPTVKAITDALGADGD